ncbi:uncharacterized protein TRIADDRAFT_60748 [Trichoplax adhaerens]|uniref:Homeobox domain-containing protein n=2 Tax=Trichoplax adhaerens TaxID=10228 RepID=B3S8U6_TRIAD|nr:hypothetical protein TRIADDRAFT_60748 [Trichoplax adhaerens]EDV20833.1 hypothetical protein TRIADDRAFT_60748 [Trichoplax adhaerens]|eukprot:XP_002116774.1 hypothetical protein TRIADDRAFT_60748 [Trichoplax adhaerens]
MGKRRSGRRRYGSKLRRISFTPDQLNALGHEFTLNPYCPGKRGIAIASKINVSSKQVSTWFQNKRAKEKRVTLNNLNGSSALGDYDSSTSSSSNNPNITVSEEEGSNATFNTQTSQAPFSSVTKI